MQDRPLLLIDDDADDQEIFLAALEELPNRYVCETRSNGLQALHQLKEGSLAPGLIFLDLNMPLMDGKQFLHELRRTASLSHIPVVIYSTTNDARTIAETMELGANRFVSKPPSYTGLVNLLQHLLEEHHLDQLKQPL